MTLLTLKAIHIIGFVAWFAGLFYLVRLFVYHAEAFEKTDPERQILIDQYTLMEKRLFRIIASPAMVITLIGGIGMLIVNSTYMTMGWMHLKLTLILILLVYHHLCIPIMKKLRQGKLPMTPWRFRLFNEVPTLLLIAITLLGVLKNSLSLWTLLIIVVVLIAIMTLSAFAYKRSREKKSA